MDIEVGSFVVLNNGVTIIIEEINDVYSLALIMMEKNTP